MILPTVGWRQPHAIRPPEWAYAISPILDTRTDDVRFADLVNAGFTHALGPSIPDAPSVWLVNAPDSWVGPGGPYSAATALHAANVDGAVVTRGLVFGNNVGRVSFSREDGSDGPLSVTMAVRFVRSHPASEDEKAHDYVVHSASLAATSYVAPPHVGGA